VVVVRAVGRRICTRKGQRRRTVNRILFVSRSDRTTLDNHWTATTIVHRGFPRRFLTVAVQFGVGQTSKIGARVVSIRGCCLLPYHADTERGTYSALGRRRRTAGWPYNNIHRLFRDTAAKPVFIFLLFSIIIIIFFNVVFDPRARTLYEHAYGFSSKNNILLSPRRYPRWNVRLSNVVWSGRVDEREIGTSLFRVGRDQKHVHNAPPPALASRFVKIELYTSRIRLRVTRVLVSLTSKVKDRFCWKKATRRKTTGSTSNHNYDVRTRRKTATFLMSRINEPEQDLVNNSSPSTIFHETVPVVTGQMFWSNWIMFAQRLNLMLDVTRAVRRWGAYGTRTIHAIFDLCADRFSCYRTGTNGFRIIYSYS